MGYSKIAGTPVVTGLYTLLLPLVAFAALGSSRYLVLGHRRHPGRRVGDPGRRRQRTLPCASWTSGTAGRWVSAAGALLPARLPGGLPLANPVGGIPHRRRLPCGHRGAGRNVAPTGAQHPTGSTTVRGAPANKRRAASPNEWRLALATAASVVVLGVERGVLLATALSLLDHLLIEPANSPGQKAPASCSNPSIRFRERVTRARR